MLRDEDADGAVKRKSLAVAQAAREALGRGEALLGLVRVRAPDAGVVCLLGAGIVSWRGGEPVLLLASVGGRAKVNEKIAFRRDQERRYRMVAGSGQAGADRPA